MQVFTKQVKDNLFTRKRYEKQLQAVSFAGLQYEHEVRGGAPRMC